LNNNKAKIVIEPDEWKKGTAIPTGLIYTNWILL